MLHATCTLVYLLCVAVCTYVVYRLLGPVGALAYVVTLVIVERIHRRRHPWFIDEDP